MFVDRGEFSSFVMSVLINGKDLKFIIFLTRFLLKLSYRSLGLELAVETNSCGEEIRKVGLRSKVAMNSCVGMRTIEMLRIFGKDSGILRFTNVSK